ncbi:ABC transporter ATP-binding protein [Gemella sp. oral taxon 928]|uniref:ABC transporter ATP-binding protein n=1 Tax=unclassified Gemella TaxID=2624949 RepID=UPI0007682206|nr:MULTISPECIES: ABC transporter ATP-binding protein [unclassified Gemella]AME09850.1 ABC transporter ATP-binding protein [Gemella sp. oral taxon 928]AXI25989.1 ABC transporter ATP-binding protein [Gemella sp. ND 6198]
MEYILEVNGLTKIYSAFELKPTSFRIEAGEVMGFIGRNGAGKTTALKSILNLVHPNAGSVRILGMDYLDNEDEIKQQIGYAVGGIDYYKRKKLKDIVAITRIFYDNWDDEAYRHYLTAFKLDENKKIMELSEGMKVKFYLTLALSHHAKLLILDEPTSGLDPVSRDEMNEIFRKLAAKGVAILFSTHITSDLEKCANTITYIKNGELLLSTKKEEFIRHYTEEIGGTPTLEDIMAHIEREEVNL